jgi:hypothetical protein
MYKKSYSASIYTNEALFEAKDLIDHPLDLGLVTRVPPPKST